MSCKILTGDTQHLARPLPWRVLGNGGSKPASAQASGVALAADTDGREFEQASQPVRGVRASSMQSAVRQAHDSSIEEGLAGRPRECCVSGVAACDGPSASVVLRVAGLRARIRKETESDIVTLTVAIARRVLRRELSVDPEAIHGVVKAAL